MNRIRQIFHSVKTATMQTCKNYKDAYVLEFPSSIIRRKHFSDEVMEETRLDRCLNMFDLTCLGIGSTLGLGIYVLAGQVAGSTAGPSVVLSFLIAAVASAFAGVCYAEFGARVPRAGSAYIYSYVTIGEFIAFVIGWNLILEYAIGTASVARGYSGYIDSLLDKRIEHYFRKIMPIDVEHMSSYPDFLAFGITMFLAIILSVGVKESSKFNTVFTCINLLVVIYVVICGSFKADLHNWKLTKSEIPSNAGEGGFFPFGFAGMMAGAATCFYAFVGFDCIATTGEEVNNPQRSIPLSIIFSLIVVFFAYCGVSAIQTLMWPYWDQDNSAPLPTVFEKVGWISAKWIISIGALAGLSTSLLGAMFPLPRVLYAMANDGLIFRFLANVHQRFKTPFIATYLSGFLAASLAMLFNVDELAKMMSIGTLLAYTLVAVSVLILRYRESVITKRASAVSEDELSDPNMSIKVNSYKVVYNRKIYTKAFLNQIFNLDKISKPTDISSTVATALISLLGFLILSVNVMIHFLQNQLLEKNIGAIFGVVLIGVLIIVCLIALCYQPINSEAVSFKVPGVPFIPLLSVFINFYLIMQLNTMTWIRFGGWMGIGFLIYFGYGIVFSSQRQRNGYHCLPEPIDEEYVKTEDTPLVD